MKSQNARKFYVFIWLIILNMLFIVSCNLGSLFTERPSPLASDTPSVQRTLAPSSTLVKIPTATESPSPVASSTRTLFPAITPTPISNTPTATFIKNANCRSGPGTNYGGVTSFLKGQVVQIIGRYTDFDNVWLSVSVPNTDKKCWVSQITVIASGNLDEIPIIRITSLPTSTKHKSTPIAPPPVEFTIAPP